MGRAQTRIAIFDTVTNAAIPYVGTVYAARPLVVSEDDYDSTLSGQAVEETVNGSAMVIVVHIESDQRRRVSDTGRAFVNDMEIHTCALELFFASTGGDAVAAQEDYDGIVDALIAMIRGNPTMSAPATVWSAGEYRFGVHHVQETPVNPDELTTIIIGTIRFECFEQMLGDAGTI